MILPVDHEAYLAASETVMATLREQPGATVQVLGWDEAFVGTETENPEAYARQVQAAVLERTRLHCSVGIGDTLVRAKVATGFGKPAASSASPPRTGLRSWAAGPPRTCGASAPRCRAG